MSIQKGTRKALGCQSKCLRPLLSHSSVTWGRVLNISMLVSSSIKSTDGDGLLWQFLALREMAHML